MQAEAKVWRLEDYRPSDFLIPAVKLAFSLSPKQTIVRSELTVVRRAGVPEDAPLVLDGDELALRGASLDGAALEPSAFSAAPDRFVLHAPPSSFTLVIETAVAPAANTELMGLYRSGGNYCTQCEAEGFRRITYFLDRPDVLSVYTVRLEAEKAEAPLLLSNGNPVERGDLGCGRHYALWHDPHPKPCYLFALVAGDLGRVGETFTTMSGRRVALNIFVEHGKENRAGYAMDALVRSMRWDEEVWGREYDLDVFNVVAVSDFNMGAMENKGLNVFNDKYVLADAETATDADYANIEAIIAHEYFHNWTGNRITCRDWFQLCLKEGLTVYRDHEFSADQRSAAVERIGDVRTLRAHQFPEDQGPLAHPVRPRRYREINNFYTATVYEKGSEVVGMIRTVIGPQAFREGMDLYFDRHDGDAATVEDFLQVFADVSGRDLAQFSLWYHQAGTPNLAVRALHDPAAATLTLEIEQSLTPSPGDARKKLMHIPLAFGLVGPDGRDVEPTGAEGAEVADGVIHLRKRRHSVRFAGVPERPALSLNRGFAAPVTLTVEQKRDDLVFLARFDTDPFSRWQAFTTLATEALIEGAHAARRGNAPAAASDLPELAGAIAGNDALEPAFRALVLTLPSEADVAREIGADVDPDAIRESRDALVMAIGRKNHAAFKGLYDGLAKRGAFSPDAGSAGRRALRNALLDLLAVADADPASASAHFRDASNMTERAAALAVLAHRFGDTSAAQDALRAFEERFADDPLVMDKWFAIRAGAPGPETVQTVQALMRHPAFSIDNPNRVRALVGTFASANQTGFHRPDGSGYRLLASVVLDVGRRNPQVAARLATAMRSWRSLEPNRRGKAQAALVSIARAEGLSTDVRDIVERTLA